MTKVKKHSSASTSEDEVEREDTIKVIKHESCKQSEASSSSNSSPSTSESDTSSDPDDDNISIGTTEILSNDPLYFVLSKLFVTEDNKNLATILEQINQKLDCLVKKSKK